MNMIEERRERHAAHPGPAHGSGNAPVPPLPVNICLNGGTLFPVHRKFNLFRKPGMKKQLFTVPTFHDLFL